MSIPDFVKAPAGALEGIGSDGVRAYLGIPFAAPPIGNLRWQRPVRIPAWDGVRNARNRAVAAPQGPSRADLAMGPMDVAGYGEDCLTLNVWTPAVGPGIGLPVFVWFHGGGFITGAGSASWYEGAVLARRGDIVVVTVNYRLGALGYLYLAEGLARPGPVANLGLQDQLTALEWVRDNIASFGGDPDNVTVAGQSAGGLSIVGLAALPQTTGLFHRAIIHSSGPSQPANPPDRAQHVTDLFLAKVGLRVADSEGLLNLSVEKIIAAQEQTLFEIAMEAGFPPWLKPNLAMPFQLVIDGEVLRGDPARAALQGSLDDLDLMVMCTPDEMRFGLAAQDDFWLQDRTAVVAQLDHVWGKERVALYERYEEAEPNKSPAELLSDIIGDENCVVPSIELLERRARIDRPGYFVWFTWKSPALGGKLGACHTIELPFVFNNLDSWSNAPMVAEGDQAEVRTLAVEVQDAWISFIRSGTASWPSYTPTDPIGMEFGSVTGPIYSPAGLRRAAWRDLPPDGS